MNRLSPEEHRELKLQQLIDARIEATRTDIMLCRMSTVRVVAEKIGEKNGDRSLNCNEDEAEALVRAAVIGQSWLVGERINEVVQRAIYEYVLPLAEKDLEDAERQAKEDQHERIEKRVWNHFFSRDRV